MGCDLTLETGGGVLNVRVGAIIVRDGRVLMVRSAAGGYHYSVGGRVKMGETSEQAVRRETLEELGVSLETDRLGFVHETRFRAVLGDGKEHDVYEICFYYYMKVPEGFEPLRRTVGGPADEPLEWVPFGTDGTVYPLFFKTELAAPAAGVRHIVTDERTGRAP